MSEFEELSLVVLHHHERFDGHGYPHGLSGEQIPLLSRIVSVADSYSAMVSDRPYHAKKTPGEAIAELERQRASVRSRRRRCLHRRSAQGQPRIPYLRARRLPPAVPEGPLPARQGLRKQHAVYVISFLAEEKGVGWLLHERNHSG